MSNGRKDALNARNLVKNAKKNLKSSKVYLKVIGDIEGVEKAEKAEKAAEECEKYINDRLNDNDKVRSSS